MSETEETRSLETTPNAALGTAVDTGAHVSALTDEIATGAQAALVEEKLPEGVGRKLTEGDFKAVQTYLRTNEKLDFIRIRNTDARERETGHIANQGDTPIMIFDERSPDNQTIQDNAPLKVILTWADLYLTPESQRVFESTSQE